MNGPRVAIVAADMLAGLGLRTLLFERFGLAASFFPAGGNDTWRELAASDHQLLFCDRAALPALLQHCAESRKKRIVAFSHDEPSTDDVVSLRTDVSPEMLLEALDQLLAQRLLEILDEPTALTPREIDVLKLLATGRIIKEIADILHISAHTAISHRKNISEKLSIKTISGLTVYATIHGYVSAEGIL
jgi:DNA-binding CsgD family transcriptional regulator